MVQTKMVGLYLLAMAGICAPAEAHNSCPELIRLRVQAAQAEKQMSRVLPSDRCAAYVRFSEKWAAVAHYANDNRESCDLSVDSLNEVEDRWRVVAKERDAICAGRPPRPYGADIIQR